MFSLLKVPTAISAWSHNVKPYNAQNYCRDAFHRQLTS
jgi:hypothetical protein